MVSRRGACGLHHKKMSISKHRTVEHNIEEPWFKKKRVKTRKKNKLAKQAKKRNRKK
jgi:hypothetical protein